MSTFPRRRPRAAAVLLCILIALTCAVTSFSGPAQAAGPGSQAAGPGPQAAGWVKTGTMSIPRERGAGVLLNDGRVLMIGGRNCGSVSCTNHASSELYTPSTGKWTAGPSMSTSRTNFRAVLLGSGKVLVIGGADGAGDTTAELYNPASNSFSSGGALGIALDSGYTATVLASGKVLVTGGCCGGTPYSEHTLLYTPATNSWAFGPDMSTNRIQHTATLLSSGKVLLAGGFSFSGGYLNSTELYDPATNTISPGPSMAIAHSSHQAALRPDGDVVVIGGFNASGCTGASEVYDVSANAFTADDPGLQDRSEFTASPVLLNDGGTLVAGGDCSLRTAAIYAFPSGGWSQTTQLLAGRRDHVFLRLRSGLVLATGGSNFSRDLATAELYSQPSPPTAYATPNPVIRGQVVTIGGSGFTAGELVELSNGPRVFATATADGTGAFVIGVPTGGFAARVYIDKAVGLSSGRTAYFSAPVVAG